MGSFDVTCLTGSVYITPFHIGVQVNLIPVNKFAEKSVFKFYICESIAIDILFRRN